MKVFITGITGQDGSYLAEYMLADGYEVVGLKRRTATENIENIKVCTGDPRFKLVEGDLTDPACIFSLLEKERPDVIFNLGAQSHVATSFKQPYYTMDVNYLGVLNILEAVRTIPNYNPKIYQASTSEMFGYNYKERDGIKYQDITTEFRPQSPYGVAKLAAHELMRIYRNSYDMQTYCGILFNHESPRRGELFLTRKVTKYVARLHMANQIGISIENLQLGNLDAYRDWSHAKDMVRAMTIIVQGQPGDYVVSSDETHSVRDFVDCAFKYIGEDYRRYVEINPEFFRPSEVDHLCGRSTEIRELGWKPQFTFTQLVEEMVKADIEKLA